MDEALRAHIRGKFMDYIVEVKQIKSDSPPSVFIFSDKKAAEDKMQECIEWNEANPDNKSSATLSYNNKILQEI